MAGPRDGRQSSPVSGGRRLTIAPTEQSRATRGRRGNESGAGSAGRCDEPGSSAANSAYEEESIWLAVSRRDRRSGNNRTTQRSHNGGRDNEGIIPVLARAVRAVERAAERGQLPTRPRSQSQPVAFLARLERSRV